jgi:CRP/FNR family cyclic AMP-dependent transcriptional regulator
MSNLVSILKQADIFDGMNNTQLELISLLCSEKTFNSGDIIFHEGAMSSELYVITEGAVEIQVNPALVSSHPEQPLPDTTIVTLTRGQNFGEIALVDHGVRSATARAAQRNTSVLILDSIKLLELCESYPELGYRLMANMALDMALKLRNTDMFIRGRLLHNPIDKTK